MPVGGMFSISMANKSLSPIPSNISASGFQLRLELNYPAEGSKLQFLFAPTYRINNILSFNYLL